MVERSVGSDAARLGWPLLLVGISIGAVIVAVLLWISDSSQQPEPPVVIQRYIEIWTPSGDAFRLELEIRARLEHEPEPVTRQEP